MRTESRSATSRMSAVFGGSLSYGSGSSKTHNCRSGCAARTRNSGPRGRRTQLVHVDADLLGERRGVIKYPLAMHEAVLERDDVDERHGELSARRGKPEP